jgi:hypothetical protein
LIIRGCWIGRIVGRSVVRGVDKTECERRDETITAKEQSWIIGKPTAEEEPATDEAPAIEKWRAEWARMHKRNRVAEVAKPPTAAVKAAPHSATGFRGQGGCRYPKPNRASSQECFQFAGFQTGEIWSEKHHTPPFHFHISCAIPS